MKFTIYQPPQVSTPYQFYFYQFNPEEEPYGKSGGANNLRKKYG